MEALSVERLNAVKVPRLLRGREFLNVKQSKMEGEDCTRWWERLSAPPITSKEKKWDREQRDRNHNKDCSSKGKRGAQLFSGEWLRLGTVQDLTHTYFLLKSEVLHKAYRIVLWMLSLSLRNADADVTFLHLACLHTGRDTLTIMATAAESTDRGGAQVLCLISVHFHLADWLSQNSPLLRSVYSSQYTVSSAQGPPAWQLGGSRRGASTPWIAVRFYHNLGCVQWPAPFIQM